MVLGLGFRVSGEEFKGLGFRVLKLPVRTSGCKGLYSEMQAHACVCLFMQEYLGTQRDRMMC